MRIFAACLSLLLSSTAFAVESEPENIFHADLSNPDLALAVSAFEETCMPFVLHKTELTREFDKRHMAKLMESRGYGLVSSEKKSMRVLVAPARIPWEPPNPTSQPHATRGQFTVFNGISEEVVKSAQTIVHPTGEIIGPTQIPALYRSVVQEFETYMLRADDRLTANLAWNYATINQPALNCELRLNTPSFSNESFTQSFIEKDEDWQGGGQTWSQCVKDGEDEFKFSVSRREEILTLSVKRSHLHQPKLCGGK